MFEREFGPGVDICKQGEDGDHYYIIDTVSNSLSMCSFLFCLAARLGSASNVVLAGGPTR